jgi:hypothetical protein
MHKDDVGNDVKQYSPIPDPQAVRRLEIDQPFDIASEIIAQALDLVKDPARYVRRHACQVALRRRQNTHIIPHASRPSFRQRSACESSMRFCQPHNVLELEVAVEFCGFEGSEGTGLFSAEEFFDARLRLRGGVKTRYKFSGRSSHRAQL